MKLPGLKAKGWARRVPTWTAAVDELRNAVKVLDVMAVVKGLQPDGGEVERFCDRAADGSGHRRFL